jgi:hypothetical protein
MFSGSAVSDGWLEFERTGNSGCSHGGFHLRGKNVASVLDWFLAGR